MSNAKIEIKVGAVEFSGEGEQAWVASQLERVLKAAPDIVGATKYESDKSSETADRSDPFDKSGQEVLGNLSLATGARKETVVDGRRHANTKR